MAFDWPYHFETTAEHAAIRRNILDSAGVFATWGSLLFVIVATVIASQLKQSNLRNAESWNFLQFTGQKEARSSVVLIAAWSVLVLYLVQWSTADDYLHLMKSPGQVASALIMSNVILSLAPLRKYTPGIIASHRLQSLLIFGLLAMHASLYTNFFVQKGVLLKRIQSLDVQLGLGMIGVCAALWYSGSRIQWLRSKLGVSEARLLHVALTVAFGTMLWFHVKHARSNIVRAAIFLSIGQVWRLQQATSQKSRAR